MTVTVPRGDLIHIPAHRWPVLSFTGKSQFSCLSVPFEIKDPIASMCFCGWNGTVMSETYCLAKE